MKRICLLLFSLLTLATTYAQRFENHRASSLYVLPQDTADIVFLGNSITNLHNWNEAFGGTRILNRGISGETTSGLEARLDGYIDGRPKKIFLMLGTNDFEKTYAKAPRQIAATLCNIISRIVKRCPDSRVYVESILPSTANGRTLDNIRATNGYVKAFVDSLANDHVAYLDIFSLLTGVAGSADNTLTSDGLHLSAKAYSIWCHALEPYVGAKTVYPDPATMNSQNDGGMRQTWGLRTTMCDFLPVDTADALLLGGELVAGGEWWELLRNPHVKNRGTGWWTANTTLDHVSNMLPAIFHDGASPARVFLYAGDNEMFGNGDVAQAVTKYKNIVSRIRSLSPRSKVYLLALLPTADATRNSGRVERFNSELQALAQGDDALTYIDSYTPFLKGGVADDACFKDSYYLYGTGYARMAQLLEPYIPGSKAVTETEAATLLDSRSEALMPQAYSAGEPHLYTLCSAYRGSYYMTERNGSEIYGDKDGARRISRWRFVDRGDGTFDIVNDSTGHYVAPTAAFNSTVATTTERPATGWTVKPSASLGMMAVSAGTVELNQTDQKQNAIYNWSSKRDGDDLYDLGCTWAVCEVPAAPATPTGIAAVGTMTASGSVYDLQGRMMGAAFDRLPRGIYIRNGKKIVK